MSAGLPVSPLAPSSPQIIPALKGVEFYTGSTGVKYRGRDDLFLAILPEGTVGAASLTQNQVVGAPITWMRQVQGPAAQQGGGQQPRALIVNAGNANVANGVAGLDCVQQVAKALAEHIGAKPMQIWQASTGVIGEALDPAPLIETALNAPQSDAMAAAAACLTTDTFVKTATRTVHLRNGPIRISGFAKGSGMVQPNMATMLAFVFTDAGLEYETLGPSSTGCGSYT